eukprot:TRINITY_DN7580_c0_g1_i1.p1 TRINITY_DN7580_c0_g1~~TRINITY_DN7580_c0_g1_i1.p1  ORF type:complete len:152 (-),score=10.76 TRINITY_DN7580_c0_g1_i1:227-682(-)
MAETKKPESCDACNKAFEPDPVTNKFSWLVVENYKLHPDCFRCKNCNNSINQEAKYHKKDDGSFLCINCTQKDYGNKAQLTDQANAGKCTGCGQDLGGNWVQDAQGNSYHNQCFKCLDCSCNLANSDEGYSAVGDKIYCKGCRQKQLDSNK